MSIFKDKIKLKLFIKSRGGRSCNALTLCSMELTGKYRIICSVIEKLS